MSKKRPAAPAAPPAEADGLDPKKVRNALMAQSVESIRKKAAAGKPLSKAELAQVDEFLYENTPMRVDPEKVDEPGEPPDILCQTQRAIADSAGLHVNTVTNWKNTRIAPLDTPPPYSLKGYFLGLRRRGRLGDCKPTKQNAHALWRWCFGAGAGDAINPDDPVHPAPHGWGEEKERQAALGTLEMRRKQRIEVETLDGSRIPAEAVTSRLEQLVDEVKGVLGGFLAVASKVKGLTPEQRADLSDTIQAQIAATQSELARLRAKV